MKSKEWFESWFDSPYYHLLYGNRDENEAKGFLEALTNNMSWKPGLTALDLCCGTGRHARVLNQIGFRVTGLDLSESSIITAKAKGPDSIEYHVEDMRFFSFDKKFDVVFNLFTSFGYFKAEEENIKVLKCVHDHLNKDGYFVLDFFNLENVISNLVASELIDIDDVLFKITRGVINDKIVKKIEVVDGQKRFHFEESVQAFSPAKLKQLVSDAGFIILKTFGNYELEMQPNCRRV